MSPQMSTLGRAIVDEQGGKEVPCAAVEHHAVEQDGRPARTVGHGPGAPALRLP